MKYGVIPPYGIGAVESGEFAAAFAAMAEEVGFESVWVVEHVVMAVDYRSVYPYDPSGRSPFDAQVPQPDPLLWLGYVAAATRRLRLATGILNVPQRNPLILAKEDESLMEEGCLSLPETLVKVKRAGRVVVEAWDEDERRVRIEAEDLLARVLQHEIDHLLGILIIDYVFPGQENLPGSNGEPPGKRGERNG